MSDDDRKVLFVKVPPELHEALARIAEGERRSLTAQVEVMLTKLVDERKP